MVYEKKGEKIKKEEEERWVSVWGRQGLQAREDIMGSWFDSTQDPSNVDKTSKQAFTLENT